MFLLLLIPLPIIERFSLSDRSLDLPDNNGTVNDQLLGYPNCSDECSHTKESNGDTAETSRRFTHHNKGIEFAKLERGSIGVS